MKKIKERKIILYDDWVTKGKTKFGEDRTKWKFKCPNCGNVQSIEDFKKAGIENPETKVFFSCIGRWTGGNGTLGNKESPCNYTCGGLLDISQIHVLDPVGEEHAVFEFAEQEENNEPY